MCSLKAMWRTGRAERSSSDRINQRTWSGGRTLRAFDGGDASPRSQWWSDAGERSAFLWVAPHVRGQPILDIGVGGGRTIPLAMLLSDDYVAIDYLPRMVALCRKNFPTVDIRSGDVRDLRDFEDEQFGLVLFSFNGFDGIDHVDRTRALHEIQRVLRPGGFFVFSTHNKDGPVFAATPWRRAKAPQSWPWAYRALRLVGGLITDPGHYPRSIHNWYRFQSLNKDGGDWGMSVVRAHDFGLVLHFTTLTGQTKALDEAGFDLAVAFEAEQGEPIMATTDTSYFHIVARKREPGRQGRIS